MLLIIRDTALVKCRVRLKINKNRLRRRLNTWFVWVLISTRFDEAVVSRAAPLNHVFAAQAACLTSRTTAPFSFSLLGIFSPSKLWIYVVSVTPRERCLYRLFVSPVIIVCSGWCAVPRIVCTLHAHWTCTCWTRAPLFTPARISVLMSTLDEILISITVDSFARVLEKGKGSFFFVFHQRQVIKGTICCFEQPN